MKEKVVYFFNMYTNPFNRKHSTIRQVIDRFLHPDYNNNKKSKAKFEDFKKQVLEKNKKDKYCNGYNKMMMLT